jgi:hypothetical protein
MSSSATSAASCLELKREPNGHRLFEQTLSSLSLKEVGSCAALIIDFVRYKLLCSTSCQTPEAVLLTCYRHQ